MHLLVTRPEPDGSRLAAQLEALGHQVTLAPVMHIRPTGARPDLAGVQALAFTSANGVRALAGASQERGLPVFAVGAATAGTARRRGFTDVRVAGGDVEGLAALIAAETAPEAGPVFHAAGRHGAGDLAGALKRAGITLRRQVLYEARAAGTLPESAAGAIASEPPPGGILFFSPRTARLFQALTVTASLQARLKSVSAYCLSGAVAGVLDPALWRDLAVAPAPDQPSLLAVLPSPGGAPR